MWRSPER